MNWLQKMMNLNRWGIRTVMHGSFLLMVMIPLLTMVIVSYQSYQSIVTEQSTQQTLRTLEQVSVGIDREASQIMNTVGNLIKDENLLDVADHARENVSPDVGAAQKARLNSLVRSYFPYTDELIGAVFFYRGGGAYTTNNLVTINERALRTSLWYNKSLAAAGQIKLFGVQPNDMPHITEKYINTAAVAIPPELADHTRLEVIYFIFKGSLFQHLFESSTKEQGDFLILDYESRAIAANRETYIQSWLDQPAYLYKTGWGASGEYTETMNGEKAFVTYYTAPVTKFKVIHIIPYATLTAPLQKVFATTLWIGAASTALFLLASWFFVRTITGPISRLVRAMYRVQTGSLQPGFTPSGPSEVYMLGHKFHAMVKEMDHLIKEKEEQQRAKAMAELRALQSQINPHFLLNTLNAIKLMAVINRVPNIQKMTDAFIRLLSSTFNRGGTMHTVAEELDYLEQYLYIMEFRYGSFQVHCDFDEAICNRFILKQLIQPIVENAIVHGLQHKEGEGRIWLKGSLRDDKMIIAVEDDGEGIDSKDMAELLAPSGSGSFSSMGISNVQERIRLHYGDGYGIALLEREGGGTRVEVILPNLHEPQ
ncbi:sensor histidine kinase [Paenibacillus thalictri]|uniref:histidine kinase n=1 Tax=Paenibacillus thalictri TaxID=2527873 RepID=A0A4Q9DK93_9BACL|nr:histidine kinase [Paenibacillus thalictri]TBL72482.1 HAMP domain-containing protein [Paenibacillus thalictri]